MKDDLNSIGIRSDGVESRVLQLDHSVGDWHQGRAVFLKNLAPSLASIIRESRWRYLVGCVAWLTNESILRALGTLNGCSIVVQKEDFLRADLNGPNKSRLRQLYDGVPKLERYSFDARLRHMSISSEPGIGVRCTGLGRGGRNKPRMHHKFAVWCEGEPTQFADPFLKPKAVWTGSFNWTNNATASFENAIYIEDDEIARAYFDEFQQVAALSEPLDWTSEYVEPEWWIGT